MGPKADQASALHVLTLEGIFMTKRVDLFTAEEHLVLARWLTCGSISSHAPSMIAG